MNKRLFLAIPLSNELIRQLEEQKKMLHLPVKWIAEQNLHITVHFFGSIETSSIDLLEQKIQKATQHFTPFTLEAKSIRVKHGRGYEMIWVGFKDSVAFEKLAQCIAGITGFVIARKPTPHVNLARHKAIIRSTSLPLLLPSPVSLEVTHLELWESKLSPEGSTYFSLRSFTLNGE